MKALISLGFSLESLCLITKPMNLRNSTRAFQWIPEFEEHLLEVFQVIVSLSRFDN